MPTTTPITNTGYVWVRKKREENSIIAKNVLLLNDENFRSIVILKR